MALVTEKKGGPYSTKDRKLRREKVADLYFERGFSVVNIARTLDVNRNTVSHDVNYCFLQLSKEYFGFESTAVCMAQFHRMEIQRARLVDLLNKSLEFKDRLALERMLTNIENKIMQAALKITSNKENIVNRAKIIFNLWAKQQNPTFRGIPNHSLRRVSLEARDKIEKIMNEDWKTTSGFTYLNQGNPIN